MSEARDEAANSDGPAGEMSEAEIGANLADTFPASDPPAWTLGMDHRPSAAGRERDDDG